MMMTSSHISYARDDNGPIGNEVDIDCGSTAGCGPCPIGWACIILADCNGTASASCPTVYRTCQACTNGIKDA